MGLFGKKKETTPTCACNGPVETFEAPACSCGGGCGQEIASIKVLGSGCASCHQLLENVKSIVDQMGLGVEVEYVTDMEKIMAYGVMSMPALVVNEKVVSMGKVLKPMDVAALLHKLGL